MQKQWTWFYCPLLTHLWPELEWGMFLPDYQWVSELSSHFIFYELSLITKNKQTNKTKKKMFMFKAYYRWSFTKFPSVSSLPVKSLVETIWHTRVSICAICHSHNHWTTRPQPKWEHAFSFISVFWAAVNLNYCTSSISMFSDCIILSFMVLSEIFIGGGL